MKDNHHHIEEVLIAKYLDGSIDEQELATLNSWLAADARHATLFEDTKAIWERSAHIQLDNVPNFDENTAFDSVMKRIKASEAPTEPSIQPAKSTTVYKWLLAAAAVIVIGVGIAFLYKPQAPTAKEVIQIADATPKTLNLKDSSTVVLKPQAKLAYLEDFADKERHVKLDGEAFFDITRDVNKPFKIALGDLSVQVLGTAFYIANWDDAQTITIGVQSGIVAVTQIDRQETIQLEKGQELVYNKQTKQFGILNTLDPNKLFWKTGTLEFKNTPLPEVFATLRTACHARLGYTANTFDNCRLTGRFSGTDTKAILEQIQLSFEFKFSGQDSIIIEGQPCQ